MSDWQIFLNFMTNAVKGDSVSHIGGKKHATIIATETAYVSSSGDD